ncbi:autophagy protein atg9 [Nowakowskiella sp. JEL0407]|nr:autophagy protein atg9 [Nowakowskiella sp. JEL0407]
MDPQDSLLHSSGGKVITHEDDDDEVPIQFSDFASPLQQTTYSNPSPDNQEYNQTTLSAKFGDLPPRAPLSRPGIQFSTKQPEQFPARSQYDDDEDSEASPSLLIQLDPVTIQNTAAIGINKTSNLRFGQSLRSTSPSFRRPFLGFGVNESSRRFNYEQIPASDHRETRIPENNINRSRVGPNIPVRSGVSGTSRKDKAWKVWNSVDNLDDFLRRVLRLFVWELPMLYEIKYVYEELFEVPEIDLETIPWREIVARIMKVNNSQPTTERHTNSTRTARLDAHSIANRILRKENYLCALYNKELLDLSVSWLPESAKDVWDLLVGGDEGPLKAKKHWVTTLVEWNIKYCLFDIVFDERGRIRRQFLREGNRAQLVQILQRRFVTMGYVNLMFAPFLLALLVFYFFFRYTEEYTKNPSALGLRVYTRQAHWKFREFNEMPHLLEERLRRSLANAELYLKQGPHEKLAILARFVAFIAGSFAAALLLLTLFDSDHLLTFEITPERNALFYVSIFTGVLTVARGMIPDKKIPFEPERILREVIEETHYIPDSWRDKLHTDEVRQEFSSLYDLQLKQFLNELLSVILTPFILWHSLPKCAPALVDFFREFTVHVDGIGYVCSFAEWDFRKHGNEKYGAPQATQNEYFTSKYGKMESSFLSFKANNPDWEPNNLEASTYLTNVLQRRDQLPQSGDRASNNERLHPFMPGGSMLLDQQQQRNYDRLYSSALGSSTTPGGGLSMYSSEILDSRQHGGRDGLGRGLFALLDALYSNDRAMF